ncbi:MAG: ArsR family transcriptional regulator [Desulfurococcaceae archaeon]|uniref:ArsR family transcriptional regulator n=1 Tax=Staphylothermus marinus TaxID=2280 RepID=A0A7C4HDY2_STAMA
MGNINLTPEEIEYFSRKVKLRILHEDKDIVLMTAPNEEQLVDIIRDLISEKPMNLREIHTILSGIASEDKIRRALTILVERGLAIMSNNGKYSASIE